MCACGRVDSRVNFQSHIYLIIYRTVIISVADRWPAGCLNSIGKMCSKGDDKIEIVFCLSVLKTR